MARGGSFSPWPSHHRSSDSKPPASAPARAGKIREILDEEQKKKLDKLEHEPHPGLHGVSEMKR